MYSCKKPGHDALASLQIKGGQVTVRIVRVGGWGEAGIEDGCYTISGVSYSTLQQVFALQVRVNFDSSEW